LVNLLLCAMQQVVQAPENWQEILQDYARLQLQVQELQQQLDKLLKLFKGSRSERFTPDGSQLSLFDIEQAETAPEKTEEITYTRKVKEGKKPVRQPLPESLPRVVYVVEPDGIDPATAKLIGQEVTEVLEYEPGKLYVNKIVRNKYITGKAGENGQAQFAIAPIPTTLQPIAKSNVGPGLLARIITAKYEDHLPLYRQRRMLLRDKVDIAESTIGDWVKQGLDLLTPLFEHLTTKIKSSGYLMADESPIAVLESVKPGATHKGYYWVYFDPVSHLIAFQYHKSRSGDAPAGVLNDFKGYLQTDGYAAYNQFENNKEITQLCCLAHIRRKFFDALQNDKANADHALGLIGKLYDIERQAREENMDFDARKTLRQENAVPILKELKAWMLETFEKVVPRSAIGKAITYSLTLWPRLENYLLDGKLEIDNNWVENKIRPLAIGRKNYLFAGSHESAARAGYIYSLFAMCRMEGINPEQWLTHTLANIQEHKINKIEDLLPANYKAKTTEVKT